LLVRVQAHKFIAAGAHQRAELQQHTGPRLPAPALYAPNCPFTRAKRRRYLRDREPALLAVLAQVCPDC
jgi:hypothetical protein